MESDSVRLARIEEGMVRIHDKIGGNHEQVMTALKPVVQQTYDNKDDIIRIKQNHKWIYTIMVAIALPSVFTAYQLWLSYHPHS